MATINTALVTLTLPAMDTLVDASSFSLYYESEGGDTAWLVSYVPNILNHAATGASQALCNYYSTIMDRGANHGIIEVYDISTHLDGSAHGGPVDAGNFTLGATVGANGYVEGVAAAISFQAVYGTDVEFAPGARPRARDRNRHYLGPLNTNTVVPATTSSRAKLSSTFLNDALLNIHQGYYVSSSGLSTTLPVGGWSMVVWSRKNAAVKPLAELWADDRPDYQRRRSDSPGFRYFQLVP